MSDAKVPFTFAGGGSESLTSSGIQCTPSYSHGFIYKEATPFKAGDTVAIHFDNWIVTGNTSTRFQYIYITYNADYPNTYQQYQIPLSISNQYYTITLNNSAPKCKISTIGGGSGADNYGSGLITEIIWQLN